MVNARDAQRVPAVRPMTPEDASAVVVLFVDAFDREDFSRWAHPNPQQRSAAMNARFAHTFESLPAGAITEVTGDLEAAALWLPPESDIRVQAAPHAPERVATALASINAARPRRSFWYLSYLGARTPGTGRGSALLRHRLPLCDAQGLPQALWTSSKGNVGFYAEHGFEVLNELDFGGARGWWLWRDVPARS